MPQLNQCFLSATPAQIPSSERLRAARQSSASGWQLTRAKTAIRSGSLSSAGKPWRNTWVNTCIRDNPSSCRDACRCEPTQTKTAQIARQSKSLRITSNCSESDKRAKRTQKRKRKLLNCHTCPSDTNAESTMAIGKPLEEAKNAPSAG